jgi:3-oxoacyl-[acyl-carrier-protein] synthase II
LSVAVAITGFGAVCAFGAGTNALWSAIATGRDGIRPIDRYSTEGFTTPLGAMVPGYSDRRGWRFCIEWAAEAAREALAEAGPAHLPPERIALIVGTNLASDKEYIHHLGEEIGDAIGVRGPRITLSTACTSATNAFGLGRDLLLAGIVDQVIAGGTDVLTPEIFAGFDALGLLSAQKCAPFSEPYGTTLGEGAGYLILEKESFARKRGAKYAAVLRGYGLSADAHHATAPDPTGSGVARGISAALRDAGMDPAEIDYINAHGTGTAANDPAEWRAIQSVFGARSAKIPVSSSKGHFGHAQGTAGALELITTLLCMRRGLIPPTLHYTKPRPRCPVDPVAQNVPRNANVRHIVSTNSAFSGANAAVVVSAVDPATSPVMADDTRPVRHGVKILGVSAIGAHGFRIDDFDRAIAEGQRLGSRVTDCNIVDFVPTADPRGLEPSARFLVAAAASAVASAGIMLRGPLRERAGIFAGLLRVSPEANKAFDDSIEERGLPRLSTTAFTKMVLNASAGACAKLLQLKGPTSSLTTGEGAGLSALVYAAQFLSVRPDVDLLLAGAVDEWSAHEEDAERSEGAACLVLGKSDPNSDDEIVLTGWGLAGPKQVDNAIEQACVMAGISADQATRMPRFDSIWGKLDATGPLFSCIAAVRALLREEKREEKRGETRYILITDDRGDSVSSAVLLSAKGTKPTEEKHRGS